MSARAQHWTPSYRGAQPTRSKICWWHHLVIHVRRVLSYCPLPCLNLGATGHHVPGHKKSPPRIQECIGLYAGGHGCLILRRWPRITEGRRCCPRRSHSKPHHLAAEDGIARLNAIARG